MSKKSFSGKNPLINWPEQPHSAMPFGLVKPEHVAPALKRALKKSRTRLRKIENNPRKATFKNTIRDLTFVEEPINKAMMPFYEMVYAMNTPDVQKALQAAQPEMVKFSMEVSLNEKIFERVKAVYDTADRSKLTDEEVILLDNTYNSFKNNGALLEGDARKEFEELSTRLSELSEIYGNNLVNSTAALKVIVTDKERLKGIPADTIKKYKENAEKDPDVSDDHYVIKMSPPPGAVYSYAEDRSLREQVRNTALKEASEGEFDNTETAMEILATRHRIARLLGFENHAARAIRPDTRMAETPDNVITFLNRNKDTYLPVAKEFHERLAAFAKERDGIEELMPWDSAYYTRLMKEKEIGLDEEKIRPYLELENVLQGMFDHAEKLYGIKVRKIEDGSYSKLHEDVRTYEILDGDTGEVKALYHLDPYARDYKGSGAWHLGYRSAGIYDGKREIPVSGNYCNFSKPAEGEPTLLKISDVTTLFHEFGHACHCMLAEGTYPELTGTNVQRDYVELPSQINECWAFQPEVLATYARHHETGEIIPDEFIEKIQNLDHFNAQYQTLGQTKYALLDIGLHTTDPKDLTSLRDFQDSVWAGTDFMKGPKAPPMALTFSHIMSGGYSSGYYGYKWADALVADVFEQFQKKGLYNKDLCKAFYETMIKPGGTRLPVEMHKDFMEAAGEGRRDLDPDAMYRAEGMLPAKPAAAPAPKGP